MAPLPDSETGIYVAKESFSVLLDGEQVIVSKGITRVRAGHPILKGREQWFEPLTVQFDVKTKAQPKAVEEQASHEAPVEQATAVPGEKRAGGPSGISATPKKV
jgi:hypothetical protein